MPAVRKSYPKRKAPARKPKTVVVVGKGSYYARPKRPQVRGRGDYNYKKGYGARLGKVLGEGAERLTHLLGFGDYVEAPFLPQIKSNSLTKISMGHDPPSVVNSSQGNVIVRHREYLTDITTGVAGAFNIRSWSINPGVPETFPWLSSMAQCFEQYKLRGVIFEFKSTSADALNSTNTALGTVIMATEYDSTRPDFSTKQQMENHQYAQSARQSYSMVHPIECARADNVLSEMYVRNGGDTGVDLRFTDFGKFQLATVGQQGSAIVIGELWISYEIELLKPRMPAPEAGASVYSQHLRATAGISATVPYGTNPTFSGNLPIAVGFTTTKFTLPDWIDEGWYLICYSVTGASTAVASPTISCTQGTLVQCWNSNTVTWVGDNGTDTTMSWMTILNVDGPAATVTVAGGTYPTSPTSCDLVITSFNPIAAASIDSRVEEVKDDEEEEIEEKKVNPEATADNLIARLRDYGVPLGSDKEKEYRLITHLLSKEFSK